MSESIGQPIVVDNKAGALGTISATDVAARAAPDGYTLLIGTSSACRPRRSCGRTCRTIRVADFTPITDVPALHAVLYVNADVPAKTLQGSSSREIETRQGYLRERKRHHAIELSAARTVRRHRPAAGSVQERTAVDARHGRRTHRCAVRDAHHRPGAREVRQAAAPWQRHCGRPPCCCPMCPRSTTRACRSSRSCRGWDCSDRRRCRRRLSSV
ncbi:MAG: hypothetical protein IPI73_09085 [Betaproteobacteria bacterium]|nr:hypothetical protein [Betaproteobacteria bacterium]